MASKKSPAQKTSGKQLKLTLIRSTIGYEKSQRATVHALGLRRLHYSVVREDTPAMRGMINKVTHLLKVEEV
ncbi:MAG: 50S ribosomal protein L30 [Anaerolineales bacterium]|jgi:large subunit ribosomal protein L30